MNLDDNDDLIPVDDELSLASDEQNVSDESRDGFLLEQGGEDGLVFEPNKNTGTYGVSSGDASSSVSVEQYQNSSQNDAPRIESNVVSGDIYGVATPEPQSPPLSSVGEPDAPRKSKQGKKKGRKSFFSFQKKREAFVASPDDVSLETLSERRRRSRMEEDFDNDKVERAPLPTRPFWDDLVKPFLAPGCVARLLMVAGAAFIPLLMATFFFSSVLSRQIVADAQHTDLTALASFFRCLWEDKIVFMLFCFLWGIFSVPISFQIFIDTASGADEIYEWPEYSFLGGLMDFLWIATLIILAGIPGATFFSFLGFNYLVGLIFSATLLTPIFFLACMQSDARFTLITKEVFFSLKYNCRSWLVFTGISFAFLFGTIGVSLAAISSSIVTEEGGKISLVHASIVSAILSLVFSFIPALYLRFLGRLAWIIEDDSRRRAELKEQEEERLYDDDSENSRG